MNAIDAALARQAFPPGERALLDAFFALPSPPSPDLRIRALGIGFGGADVELVGGVARIALANQLGRLPVWFSRAAEAES